MRKGQVTMFVVLGLVILIVLGVFLLKPAAKPSTEQSSQDAARLTEYVQSCLKSSGEDVLRTMGSSGGYLSTSGFKLSKDTRDSQIIDMEPQKIVMWHEIHPCDKNPSGCISNNRPPLCKKSQRGCPVAYPSDVSKDAVSIQEQLEKGTAEKVEECANFNMAFPELGVEKKSKPKVTAVIREENIQLLLDYPITFKSSDNIDVDLESFTSELDIKLPALYRFAAKIQTTEIEVAFLENVFMHLHSIYSGSSTEIPPIREVQIYGKDTGYWLQSNVKDVIENDLLQFMNFVQIINAKESYAPIESGNVDPTYKPYADGAYQYMTIKIDDEPVPYSARFEYPNTPMYLSINNGKATLKPDTFGGVAGDIFGKLSGIRFTQYKFKYTLAFPMVVHLYDPSAFNGEGYQLDFGLEANIRNNHPLNTSATLINIGESNIPGLEISDPKQLVNHIYKVKVIDSHTKQGVSRALIYYDCDNRFYMGETDSDGVWAGKLPYCISGGVIQAQGSGYVAAATDLQNSEEDGLTSQVSISMWPIRQKKVMLFKRTVADYDALSKSSLGYDTSLYKTQLTGTDTAIVELSKIKDNEYEEDFPTISMLRFGNLTKDADASSTAGTVAEMMARLKEVYDSGGISKEEYDIAVQQLKSSQDELDAKKVPLEPLYTEQLVDLIPGKYTVDGTLLYGKTIIIPEKERCVEIGGDEKCYTMPKKEFNSWVSGGAILSGDRAVVFKEDDIYSDKVLFLYVAEQRIPSNWDELEQHQDLEAYLNYGRFTYVMPEFVVMQQN